MKTDFKAKRFNFFASLPGIAILFMPKCTMCIAAYAGILSAMGIGIFDYPRYLFSLTLVFLCFSLFALFYRANERWGFTPFIAGVAAALFIVLGKFYYNSEFSLYPGVFLLVCASLWNCWPKRSCTHVGNL
jgi:mercuric ion transport protein